MAGRTLTAWTHADPDIQHGAEEDALAGDGPREILFTVTRELASEIAGREITDDEADRLVKALPFSSIPDAVSEVVSAVCGYPDEDEDEDGPEDECEGQDDSDLS
jgi:hypothetical protein